MKGARYQNRERQSGRFSFDGDMTRLCICGHSLGDHNAESPHECWIDSDPKHPLYPTNCKCVRFRLSQKQAAVSSNHPREVE